jgi:ribosomal protein L16 Arg81 hydroxylase
MREAIATQQVMTELINLQLTLSEIKEIDDAVFAAIRRMLKEGMTSQEHMDNTLKHLVSAETRIQEQVFRDAESPRMKEIRKLLSASDAS